MPSRHRAASDIYVVVPDFLVQAVLRIHVPLRLNNSAYTILSDDTELHVEGEYPAIEFRDEGAGSVAIDSNSS